MTVKSPTTPESVAAPPASRLVILAASAGGVSALRTILRGLPDDFPAAVIVLQHRPPERIEPLEEVLRSVTRIPVRQAAQGGRLEAPGIYVARPDGHLTITPEARFLYRNGSRIRFVRASANPLLESAARVLGGRVIAVVLTGSGIDATDGVQAVKVHGGLILAQDEASSEVWSMPRSAIATGVVDFVLPLERIAPALDALVHGRLPAVDAGT